MAGAKLCDWLRETTPFMLLSYNDAGRLSLNVKNIYGINAYINNTARYFEVGLIRCTYLATTNYTCYLYPLAYS